MVLMRIFGNGFMVWHLKPALSRLEVIYCRHFTMIMWTPWIQKWQQTSTQHFGKKETEPQALAQQVQGHTRRDRDKLGCCFSKGVACDVVSQHSFPRRNGRERSSTLIHPCFLPTLTRVQTRRGGWFAGNTALRSTPRQVSPPVHS